MYSVTLSSVSTASSAKDLPSISLLGIPAMASVAALQSMISDKINSVSDIGGMVLETFGAISEALTAISNQQIDQIKSQTDKDIKKIDEMYKSGEISAEQSAMYKSGIEKKANEEMQALRIKAFKQSQASAIADVVFQGAIAIAKT